MRSDRSPPDEDPVRSGAAGPPGEPDLRAWVEAQVERIHRFYEGRGAPFRVLWVVTAVLVVLFGVVLTVAPGPAVVVIALGLAMLAAAFGWARRLLSLSVRRLPAGSRPPSKRLALTLLLLALAAAAGVTMTLVTVDG